MNMNAQTKGIIDLFCATSDGSPDDLRGCISRGCPWDRPIPGHPSRSTPINIAAQYQRPENLAILATKALEEGRTDLLEAPRQSRRGGGRPLNPEGRSPAYLAVQKGNPTCLGVMAKAGANLHRAVPHTWQPSGTDILVDPDDDGNVPMPIHRALVECVVSFTSGTCAACAKDESECAAGGARLQVCAQCKMAYFCSAKCQREKWSSHKKVCKKIRQGADLVTFHDAMPRPARFDADGFEEFREEDRVPVGGENYDPRKRWEYYDLRTRSWRAYPAKINEGIEGMRNLRMSPRYMYKPGPLFDDAEGAEERELSTNPPRDVATNHVYYRTMIDHDIYTGCGRRIRRRIIDAPAPAPAEAGIRRRVADDVESATDDEDDDDDDDELDPDQIQMLERMYPEMGSLLREIGAGVEENEEFIRRINAARGAGGD